MMRLTDCAKDGTLAYIAMGSNLGDREYYLREAVNRLAQESRIQVIAESSLYETEPVGYTEQGAFLNQVIAVRTTMTAHDLLYLLLDTERDLGRTREIRFGPRTLDLDLLLYGNDVIHTKDLIVPHPRMEERAFVLIPLTDVASRIDSERAVYYENLLMQTPGKEGVVRWKKV